MVDTGHSFSENKYVQLLAHLYEVMKNRYGKPYFVFNDAGRDSSLAENVSKEVGDQIEQVLEPTAVVVKGIIGASCFVYSDRLHGAISAAQQCVPVAASGWSHKYEYMLADFGLEWALMKENSVDAKVTKFKQIVDRYDNEKSSGKLDENFSRQLDDLSRKNHKMWAMIFELIDDRFSRT